MISEEIPSALEGERIDRVVAMLTSCTRAESADALQRGLVTIDSKAVTKPSHRVRLGNIVAISEDPHTEPPGPQGDSSVKFLVIHEDDDIIVIDKPAGLVVHPAAGNLDKTLVNGLLARFPELADVGEVHRPGIVHRLDRGTSGLMVVARTNNAYEELVAQLSSHEVDRRYEALVWGALATPGGTIDAPIGRSRRNPLLMTISQDGRFARTHYERVTVYDDPAPCSLVRCSLETGRTHQIRVHLRSIGHPVVGDDFYGGARPMIKVARPFLHARYLGFEHPTSGVHVEFESPLAADLAEILPTLRVAEAPPSSAQRR